MLKLQYSIRFNIRQKNLLRMQWDRKDLGTMVSWFKRPGDKALPGNKEML
jgi:hypothetical protein